MITLTTNPLNSQRSFFMEAMLHQEAATTTFCDVHRLICNLAHQHRRRYGGAFEDLYSEACELFVICYESFRPELGAFTTWCTWKVQKGLLEKTRRRAYRNKRLGRVDC